MLRSLPLAARVWSALYVLDAVLVLVGRAAGADTLAEVAQWCAMPLLAAAVVTATRWPRGRLVTWTLVALGCSWLGDTLPATSGGDSAFLLMVGGFLLAQVAYVMAFGPDARRSVAYRHPGRLVPYGVVLVVLVGLCAPHAGALLVPVAVYGGVLVAMAVLATGLSPLAGAAGAVFVVSDGLIALEAFVPTWHLPGQDVWVMVTYLVAQAMLAAAVVDRNHAARRARPVAAGAPRPPAPKPDNVVTLVGWTGAPVR
ncbi:lysoplasmalogenase [Cellulomonas fimi]|uniref:lysoplasmalogenase n=1 Tax=Cellulomonas fimi TaxID=1708 RepID=UPI00234E3631|nr:lysoplasmalogenase [Cellulomonas fimi]MDC7121797.1 lysoplasmalogenase [Cellulomonas fimi]